MPEQCGNSEVLSRVLAIGIAYAKNKCADLARGEEDPCARYREAIEANGGRVVPLRQDVPPEQLDAQLRSVDGVLLPGGYDIDPKFFGAAWHDRLENVDPSIDEFEFGVLTYGQDHKLPVLCICRGIQVLNVHYGGTLIQDIPSEHTDQPVVVHRLPEEGNRETRHPITIAEGSLLHQLLGTGLLTVNSSHHEGVGDVAPGFTATAWTEDGIVEAIERPGPPPVIGVQFHPERMLAEDARHNALFRYLVEQASIAKTGPHRGAIR